MYKYEKTLIKKYFDEQSFVDSDIESFNAFIKCSVMDGKDLIDVDSILTHGLKSVANKCKNKVGKNKTKFCGHTTEVELDGGQALILPFRKSQKSTRSRIQFGIKNSRS